MDPEACVEILDACYGEEGEHGETGMDPEEPPFEDECDRVLFECLDAGVEPQICDEEYFACIGDAPDCPDDGEADVCESILFECLESGEAPELCDHYFAECLGEARDPEEPPHGEEPWPPEGEERPDGQERPDEEGGPDGEPPEEERPEGESPEGE